MKLAIVLLNMGGPDSLEAVRPFLFNLFDDPAIIGAPWPIRRFLAWRISRRRAPVAREIYARIGGRSPLVELTRAQGDALEAVLASRYQARAFVAMRYWHPFSVEAAAEVRSFAPERIVVLPLYPQYSTATSASSLLAWRRAAKAVGLTAPTVSLCCYPTETGWVDAQARLIATALDEAAKAGRPRVLFSAHGLPRKLIESGDPYQWQVEATTAAVVERLGKVGLDWSLCYQSRVGPLEWLAPSTEDELARAGRDRVPVVVVPIAFVSEHSETLVELDIEYRDHARELGVPAYVRVPAVGTHPAFIDGLARLVAAAATGSPGVGCGWGEAGRMCPEMFGRCGHGH